MLEASTVTAGAPADSDAPAPRTRGHVPPVDSEHGSFRSVKVVHKGRAYRSLRRRPRQICSTRGEHRQVTSSWSRDRRPWPGVRAPVPGATRAGPGQGVGRPAHGPGAAAARGGLGGPAACAAAHRPAAGARPCRPCRQLVWIRGVRADRCFEGRAIVLNLPSPIDSRSVEFDRCFESR